MRETKTDSLGHVIEGEPTIGPRGNISRNDSLTTDKLVELLSKALMSRKQQPSMASTDNIDSIGNKQENVVPIGPRGPHAARDTRRA